MNKPISFWVIKVRTVPFWTLIDVWLTDSHIKNLEYFRREAGLLLGSSNPHPSYWPLSFPLDPPPIIIHPANPKRVLWTLSPSPNSHHPPNPTNPGRALRFVDLHPFWQVGLTFRKIRSLLCLRSRNKKTFLIWVHGSNFEKKWKKNFEIFYQLTYVPKFYAKSLKTERTL